ncbi:MAG: ADP-ribosylglycohydrolase family protein [Oscillospiraceae bacterium]|nr:ADP-ribosylglycohydrolase family protein [Oscillospiraceae bacterium]
MLGAVIGDIAGSKYEFNNIKTKNFNFLAYDCTFTDDTVMTAAVARACLDYADAGRDIELFPQLCIKHMQALGRLYPRVGYGGRFYQWLMSADPQPYGSFGNGSAMRVSPVAWCAESLEEALDLAAASARISHDDPDGIRGALAAAGCTYLARTGADKKAIRAFAEEHYPLDFTIDQIRPDYSFDVSCAGSVPQAIECFLESDDFEDTIRTAISLGGDCDTTAAIAGGIAEAMWGVPQLFRDMALMFIGGTPIESAIAEAEARFGARTI